MPSGALILDRAGGTAVTGDAAGARTARSANDVLGTANPDIESTFTAVANTNAQSWGHRRFVSAPLATQTIQFSATWQANVAASESNVAHNQNLTLIAYAWRPSTGAVVGTASQSLIATIGESAGSTESVIGIGSGSGADVDIKDGDIIVFDITSPFTQSMAVAYTEQFAYDGTTELSATTSASLISTPSAITLFTPRAKQSSVVKQAVNRSSVWVKGHSGIVVPRLWTPADLPGV